MKLQKKDGMKIVVVIAIVVICVFIFVLSIIISVKSESADNDASSVILSSSNTDVDDVINTETDTVVSEVETDSSTDTNTDSDTDSEVLLPIDCNRDFWAVKLGIAECYDHVFKKGHMTGTTYYSGDCDEHDMAELQKLAQQVKLYREENEYGEYSYTATLPEMGWIVYIYDPKLQAIIDSQIEGDDEFTTEDISIVLYFYENSIQIEMADEN